MKAARFDYRRAGTLEEAIGWLQEGEGRAKAIAGGQSLGPMLNLRLARPATVIDISKVPEWNNIYDAFRNVKSINVDGQVWAVPFTWGANPFLYRSDKITTEPDSIARRRRAARAEGGAR